MRRWLISLPGWSLGYALVLELMTAAAILYWPNFEENVTGSRNTVSTSSWRVTRRILMPMASEPAPGSVRAKQSSFSPRTTGSR